MEGMNFAGERGSEEGAKVLLIFALPHTHDVAKMNSRASEGLSLREMQNCANFTTKHAYIYIALRRILPYLGSLYLISFGSLLSL